MQSSDTCKQLNISIKNSLWYHVDSVIRISSSINPYGLCTHIWILQNFVGFGEFYKYINASEACFHEIVASSAFIWSVFSFIWCYFLNLCFLWDVAVLIYCENLITRKQETQYRKLTLIINIKQTKHTVVWHSGKCQEVPESTWKNMNASGSIRANHRMS